MSCTGGPAKVPYEETYGDTVCSSLEQLSIKGDAAEKPDLVLGKSSIDHGIVARVVTIGYVASKGGSMGTSRSHFDAERHY